MACEPQLRLVRRRVALGSASEIRRLPKTGYWTDGPPSDCSKVYEGQGADPGSPAAAALAGTNPASAPSRGALASYCGALWPGSFHFPMHSTH
jgi:hypothetical protein